MFISNCFVCILFLVTVLYKIILDFLWKEREKFTFKRKDIDLLWKTEKDDRSLVSGCSVKKLTKNDFGKNAVERKGKIYTEAER